MKDASDVVEAIKVAVKHQNLVCKIVGDRLLQTHEVTAHDLVGMPERCSRHR